mmetsp:Transcript_24730/g.54252  ORF Transcript_24730/g.54252 Transcript_24730/m.54252 type:complete len:307 (+) Transcript_24730:683-1603(+)|eukprot:CAMPEP_0168202694 /NCGR_PEP_ID=MMETSP0139_2-20121125/24426_1 /TAXON_ID=44445 /ORGANISM="Pseudo-nitzschia australis, Strain 10249 10 AB" /LENGTH=306 /DNA_ID=CAMNT_0008128433 /DNA_START=365 /DNA_END=1285 /DNA_ORIENTATION=+
MTDVNTSSKSSSPVAAVIDTSFNKLNVINFIAYVVNSIVTYSIQFGWIDRPDNGEISDKYATIVTPFGTSFLIWSVIFMWQLFWVVWQFLPSQRNSEGVTKAWYYYPIVTVMQAGWTISFSFEIMWLSLVFMYGILITLVAASMSLHTYKKTWKGYMLWQGPFSLQTGWIMAASAVNTNVLPVYYEASTTIKIVVSSLSLVVLVATAFTWLSSYPVDFAIPLVIVWALVGVYMKLQTPPQMILDEFSTKQINGVQYGVLAGIVVIGAGIVAKALYVLIKQRPAALKEAQQSSDQKSEPSVSGEESA